MRCCVFAVSPPALLINQRVLHEGCLFYALTRVTCLAGSRHETPG
jgi:hypothetical protein